MKILSKYTLAETQDKQKNIGIGYPPEHWRKAQRYN